MAKTLTVKEWSAEDKPREKMIAQGKKALSDAELLGIIIGSGNPEQNVVDLAKEILSGTNNSLLDLSRLRVSDLILRHKGVGPAKAVSIIAALELGYRMLNENKQEKDCFATDSQASFNYISPKLIDLPHEEFWCIYLNIRNKILFSQRIASGGLTETSVDLRIIFQAAIERNAVGIILVHNHPSGNLSPSKEDLLLTKSIMQAGSIMRIKIVDHLIVGITPNGSADYYSMVDANTLPR